MLQVTKMKTDESYAYTLARDLINDHVFQLPTLRAIKYLLRKYATGNTPLDSVIYEIRTLACVDFQNFSREAFNVVINFSKAKGDASATGWQAMTAKAIKYFGPHAYVLGGELRIPEYDDIYSLNSFIDAIKYVPLPLAQRRKFVPKSVSPLASRANATPSLMPKMQADLENALSEIVQDGSGAVKTKGHLPIIRDKLTTVGWDNPGMAVESIEDSVRNNIEVRIPFYFPMTIMRATVNNLDGEEIKSVKIGMAVAAVSGLSALDSFSDKTTAVIYVFKLLRFLMQLGALWIAVKIFNVMYVKNVYAGRKDPPKLSYLLNLYLALDMTFQLLTITVFVLLTAPKNDMSVVINDEFMSSLLVDQLLTSLMIFLLGIVVAKTIWRKTYFHYKTDGLGAIKSYADILVGVSAAMVVVPFFMVL
jgi:hypothetical protein